MELLVVIIVVGTAAGFVGRRFYRMARAAQIRRAGNAHDCVACCNSCCDVPQKMGHEKRRGS